jgi:Skp family chaperone for outer membrane proteins
MRNILFLKIFFFIIFISHSEANNITYIDMEKLINKSIAGININKKINELKEIKTAKIKKAESILKKKQDDLLNQKNIITREVYNEKLVLLNKEINEFNKMRNLELNDFENKKKQYTNKLLKAINPMLQKYVQSKNISILLQKKNIILGANEFDITSDVLKILNDEIKEISIK